METAEPAPASLGPRYAPEDPTLPKPWKGLIDGSTNIMYYWNPETNVTQYERPVPPLSSGTPPVASTPKLAPLPMTNAHQSNGVLPQQAQHMSQTQTSQTSTQQSNGMLPQQGQYMSQTPASQMHYISQSGQQQGYPMHHQQQQNSQTGQQQQASQSVPMQGHPLNHQQQQGSQIGQAVQQNGLQGPQQVPQMGHSIQQSGQLMQQPPGQQMLQQPAQQIPQHLGQQMAQPQGLQMPFQQAQQYPHQPLQQMPYQQSPHQQSQQMSHTRTQQFSHQQGQHYQPQQGQQFPPQQLQMMGFPQRGEDTDFHQGKQIGVSPSQSQPPGVSSIHNMPHGAHSVQMPPMGSQSYQPQQYGNTSLSVPHTGSSFVKFPQAGNDSTHQQHIGGSMIQSQSGLIVHNHQTDGTSIGVKTRSEEDLRGRPGNDFYYNANKEIQVMAPQQPKPLAGPMDRNHQDTRMGVPHQNAPPNHSGGLNVTPGSGMPNMYNHVDGGQSLSSNNAPLRPPAGALSSTGVANLSAADAYRRQHEVTATGDNVPAPFMTFEATGFPPEILREMQSAGFSTPTPIQAQTWPIALQNNDIVAIAKTGSGKTLGYLIPAFIHLRQIRNDPLRGPTVLVLAPTRELATQIQDEALKFGRSSRFSCTCLYGGAPKGLQIKELDRGADIVVATPGRLNDILEMKKIDFRQVSLLVLDEADRMLDMGFEPQIRKIVNEIPPRRQTLMFTATWPKEVRKIAGDLLVHPVQVNIGNVDELAANKSITQHVEVVHQMQKQRRIEQILRSQDPGSKVIIFCSTKRLCDQLTRSIGRTFGAAAIHGDKSQGERDYVLNQFRSGKSPVLVATDVAARGLDIKDIRVVINYDFPTGIEDYVHRIGRTGRAGATGISYTFFSEHDSKYAADLIKLLEGANQRVPPEVREIAESFARGRGGYGGGRWSGGGFRDEGFGGRGGRMEYFSGRGNRGQGQGFSGGRYDRGPQDRYGRGPQDRYMDRRGRFDDRRGSRGRSYSRSRSPEGVRTWGRSRSRSRTHSRSRSWSRSRSRSSSYSRGRSRSRSQDRYEGTKRQKTDLPSRVGEIGAGIGPKMSPGRGGGGSGNGVGPQVEVQVQLTESSGPEVPVEPV